MDRTDFIHAEEVAKITNNSNGRAFLRIRHRLETEEGFPLPMPTSRNPLFWRREQVESWVKAQGVPMPATPVQTGGNVFLLREAASA